MYLNYTVKLIRILVFLSCFFWINCDVVKTQDCAGVDDGEAYIDGCGICTEGTTGLNANYLMDCMGICNGNASEIECGQTIQIFYNSVVDITGFQFEIIGDITITDASGGDAQSSGFSVTTGNNIVIGFSFSGGKIPAGAGLLTILSYEGILGNYCLENLILTTSNATTINAQIINCNTIKYGN